MGHCDGCDRDAGEVLCAACRTLWRNMRDEVAEDERRALAEENERLRAGLREVGAELRNAAANLLRANQKAPAERASRAAYKATHLPSAE